MSKISSETAALKQIESGVRVIQRRVRAEERRPIQGVLVPVELWAKADLDPKQPTFVQGLADTKVWIMPTLSTKFEELDEESLKLQIILAGALADIRNIVA